MNVLRAQRALTYLDDLLVTPLDGALSLVQVHHVAVPVAEDLKLDVSDAVKVLFDKQRVVPERVLRLALRGLRRQRSLNVLSQIFILCTCAFPCMHLSLSLILYAVSCVICCILRMGNGHRSRP